MNNEKIIQKIRETLVSIMSKDSFHVILRACEEIDKKRKIEEKIMNKNIFTWPQFAMALGLAAAVILGGMYTINTPVQALTIMLDVNPSISLEAEDGKIVAIKAENDDAEIILGDLDLVGVDAEVAVNTLVEAMLENGYISETQNTVLLSVDGDDDDELAVSLSKEVQTILSGASIEGAVIYQDLDDDDDLEELANANAISMGKASLIENLMEMDETLVFEELAPLSVNQLGLLLQTKSAAFPKQVQQQGSSNSGSYLTSEEVTALALNYFGLNSSMITDLEVEFDVEDGIFTYEVEIETAEGEFEVDINALTGEIIEVEIDDNDDDNDDDDDDNDDSDDNE